MSSANSQNDSITEVERVGVRAIPPRLVQMPTPQSTSSPVGPEPRPTPPPVTASRTDSAALGAFVAIGMVLAARWLLMLSVVGAFVLAIRAMENPTFPSLSVLCSFCVLTVLPLTYLDLKTRGK